MKIELYASKFVNFSTLKKGQTFTYNGIHYMKTGKAKDGSLGYEGVIIETGELVFFPEDCKVSPTKLKVVLDEGENK